MGFLLDRCLLDFANVGACWKNVFLLRSVFVGFSMIFACHCLLASVLSFFCLQNGDSYLTGTSGISSCHSQNWFVGFSRLENPTKPTKSPVPTHPQRPFFTLRARAVASARSARVAAGLRRLRPPSAADASCCWWGSARGAPEDPRDELPSHGEKENKPPI